MVSSASEKPVSASKNTAGDLIKGEGDVKYVRRVRQRIPCDYCGEPADNKHTYLFPDARRNPQSSAYGRDDCTYCEDHAVYTCKDCRDAEWNGMEPKVDGYRWCSTFYNMKAMPHLFLKWVEYEIPAPAVKPEPLDNSNVADEK